MKLRDIFIFKFDSIVLVIASFLMGYSLFFFPSILGTYKVYEMIRNIFDNQVIGFAFMFLALSKFLGIVFNWRLVKKFALKGLLFLWLLFLISFLLTPPPNTIWILAVVCVILAIGGTIKER